MAVWGRRCIQEPLRGTWLIRLRHWGDEWVCEGGSIWHDKALMRWQVVGSFSCSSPVIIPTFHFSHILSLFRNPPPAGFLVPVRRPSPLPRLFFSAASLLICFLFSLFSSQSWRPPPSPTPSLAALCADIYSNRLTGLSGGRRCEYPLGKKMYTEDLSA